MTDRTRGPVPARTSRGAARVGVLATAAFLLGGAAIGVAVYLGWGSTPSPSHAVTGTVFPNTSTPTASVPAGETVADSLTGVWCGRRDACVAVGTEQAGASTDAIAEFRSAHARWTIERTPTVDGATLVQLSAISCVGGGPRWCVAVGTVLSPVRHALAELYDGKSWSFLPTAEIGEGGSLTDVVCRSRGNCLAVGSFDEGGAQRPLLEQLSDGTWTLEAAAGGTGSSALDAITCARACIAVGESAAGRTERPLAEERVGGKWVTLPSLLPRASEGGTFNAVACPSKSSCVAVGVQYGPGGIASPLVSRLRDGTFVPVFVRRSASGSASATAFSLHGELLGVSCLSVESCTAVGARESGSGTISALAPLILTESAGEWFTGSGSLLHSPATTLADVSCRSGAPCEAVGSSLRRPGRTATLVVAVGSGVTAVEASASPGLPS